MLPLKRNRWIILSAIIIVVLLTNCGPSPEEQAATEAALTAAAATSTPTVTPTFTPTPIPTSTPTPTPIPYDLTVLVKGEDDAPVIGATVVLTEIGEVAEKITDDSGQVCWNDLPGKNVTLNITAQGYLPKEISEMINRGDNELNISLERDLHGLFPSDACSQGESLLYIEDFQDGEAKGWPEIEAGALGWKLIPLPGMEEDIVLRHRANVDAWATLDGFAFNNAVARVQFMAEGDLPFVIYMPWVIDPYEVEDGTVEFASYQVIFHPDAIQVFRQAEPFPTKPLLDEQIRIARGSWHILEISLFNGVLELWVDGVRHLRFTDQNPLPSGTLGFEVWQFQDEKSIVYFDDISVCELSAPFNP